MSVAAFEIVERIGEGSYSSVFKALRKSDGQLYALKKVKFFPLSEKEKENALTEIRILASIDHPNIVGYKEAFFDDESHSLCTVMEYADNGDLLQQINEHKKKGTSFEEKTLWDVFIQALRGLKALHDLKIMHRDIKSANIFLSKDGTVKIGDMNVSKVAKAGLVYTQTGTPYYASPEVWKDEAYDFKSDVWSLGCALYEAAALKPPFRANDMQGLYRKVIKGDFPLLPSKYSSDLFGVLRAMLTVSPIMRPTCAKVLGFQVLNRHIAASPRKVGPTVSGLLKTIYLPNKLETLPQVLPAPNYQTRSSLPQLKIAHRGHFSYDFAGTPKPRPLHDLRLAVPSARRKDLYRSPQKSPTSLFKSRVAPRLKVFKQHLRPQLSRPRVQPVWWG